MGKNLKGREIGIGITQRKDEKYSAKFTSKSGKRIERYFEKLAEARKWLAEAKYDDEHGNIGHSTQMTVDAWFNYWIAEIKGKTIKDSTKHNYISRYDKNIKPLIGNMLLNEVKPMHCQNILNVMDESNYSGGSMNLVKETLGVMFSDAVENDLIPANPVKRSVKCPKKAAKRERFLALEEQNQFSATIKRDVNYPHFLFVLQTGLRSSELRGLQWKDVDFQNRMIHVRRNLVYNKIKKRFTIESLKTGNSVRDIPMTQTAYEMLMEMERRKNERKTVALEFANHVFLNMNGNPMRNRNYNWCLENACRRIGIEPISMHILRHTFATRCIESGMKPKTLQKILGHANISVTMDLYVHLTENEKIQEMKAFEESSKVSNL